MRLDEDADEDFDGYLDDDICSRGSKSDGGDDDNSGNVCDGHTSVDNQNDGNKMGTWVWMVAIAM